MSVRPWSENIWFSPKYVINELGRAIARKESPKRYKEAWVCAVALICHSKQLEWWIQMPENDPPDVLAMNLVAREDGRAPYLSLIKVEIFEISSFDDEDVEESIERKLKNKDYSGMILVGFVRRKGVFNHKSVSDYIKKLKPKMYALFLIAFEGIGTNVSFIELFPECIKSKEDFGLFCKTTSQRDCMEVNRGIVAKKEDNNTDDILTFAPPQKGARLE